MTIGSVTGDTSAVRPYPLPGASTSHSPLAKTASASGSAGAPSQGSPRPATDSVTSGKGKTSPSTVVTLTHAKNGQEAHPVTYHRVYRSQPYGTHSPGTPKYTLVKDKPTGLKPGKTVSTAAHNSHTKDVKTAPVDKGKFAKVHKKGEHDNVPGKMTAFGAGVLGLDAPKAKKADPGFYSAGQILKAVGTVGTLVALIV